MTDSKRKIQNKEEIFSIIHKTELKTKTLNPVWNESVEEYVSDADFRLIFEGEFHGPIGRTHR